MRAEGKRSDVSLLHLRRRREWITDRVSRDKNTSRRETERNERKLNFIFKQHVVFCSSSEHSLL